MNDIRNSITERVDDIPLLLEQMQRMGLPTLLDDHFPTHGNWQGLSLGWVTTMWLSSILSRGDHRLVHVAPWVATGCGRFGPRQDKPSSASTLPMIGSKSCCAVCMTTPGGPPLHRP